MLKKPSYVIRRKQVPSFIIQDSFCSIFQNFIYVTLEVWPIKKPTLPETKSRI